MMPIFVTDSFHLIVPLYIFYIVEMSNYMLYIILHFGPNLILAAFSQTDTRTIIRINTFVNNLCYTFAQVPHNNKVTYCLAEICLVFPILFTYLDIAFPAIDHPDIIHLPYRLKEL